MYYILLIIIIVILIILYYNKPKPRLYSNLYYKIDLTKLKDLPVWLKSYDEVVIEQIEITTLNNKCSTKTHKYSLYLTSYGCDDDNYL